MCKFEVGVILGKRRPDLKDTKIVFMHLSVMKEHHGPLTELGLPGLEVVQNSLFRMKPINVQKVNAAVFKACNSLIEKALMQPRKAGIKRIVVGP